MMGAYLIKEGQQRRPAKKACKEGQPDIGTKVKHGLGELGNIKT